MIHPSYSSSYDLLNGFLHMLSCKQAQKVVHGNWRPMQPQFPPRQDLSDWQPQRTILRTCSGAYGVPDDMFLGIRDLFCWSASQPNPIGSIAGDSPVRAACHWTTWRWARSKFSLNASEVGGRLHNFGADKDLLVFCAHTNCLHSVIDEHEIMP